MFILQNAGILKNANSRFVILAISVLGVIIGTFNCLYIFENLVFMRLACCCPNIHEATAFSDPENEHLIQQAFEKLMQGKTVIMIAHRLSTIRSAHKIVVVADGRVVEEGTHEALLTYGGKYSAMWNTYTQTMRWSMAEQIVVQEVAAHA